MARTRLSLPFDGTKLRAWRERVGLTQQELGDKCGLSRYQISRWESGIARPEPGSLALLVRGLAEAARSLTPDPLTLMDLLDSRISN